MPQKAPVVSACHGTSSLTSSSPLARVHQWLGRPLVKVLALSALALAAQGLGGCSSELAPRNTHAPISGEGDISTFFYQLLLYLDIAIMVIVAAIWAYALVKFKRREGDDSLPPQNHGNMKLEVIWTAIPTLIVIGTTVPMLAGVFTLAKRPDANSRVIEVDVTGKQWWWEFDYKNDTAAGLHTANELHVLVNTTVQLNMTSADVIHAWWVPRLAGKRDATPGRNYPLYVTPREIGVFDGQCAELCGASHALMGTKLIVHALDKETEVEYPQGSGKKVKIESYNSWVKANLADAAKPASAEIEKGAKLFSEKTCATCHIVKGQFDTAIRAATSGPNLSHVGSRMTIAAATLPNSVENLQKWIGKPSAIKPGSKMPDLGLTPDEAKAIATYLYSLK